LGYNPPVFVPEEEGIMAEPVSTPLARESARESAREAGEGSGGPSWGLTLGLVLFALLLLVVRARLEPPAPEGADAPATEFSAARAGEILRSLAGDGSPHPAGSLAHTRIREQILAELRRLGYATEVQEGFACNANDTCAVMRNVIGRLEGSASGPSVLLMAHYDSVPAGPGAGDDLSGVVTILEVARALKAGPPPRNPVVLLFTDGEELGLLGAELFANRHPAANDVGVVINLEARGTGGPSLMFETSGEDGWLVREYAGAAPRPITSSVYATIYELMPNDTDLTVFKRRDVEGLNFAFVRNPLRYHSAIDSVENLSPASLQHHGDNALAAARALAQADLASPPQGDAVFFDVLGLGVVRWPQGWTVVLAVVALALVIAAVVRGLRRAGGPRRGLLFGVLAFLAALVLAVLLSVGLLLLLRGAMPFPWVAGPQPDIAAFWLLGLAVVSFVAAALSRRAGAAGLWAGVWILWGVLGLAVALTAPGISYLFLVPALAAGIAGLVSRPGGAVASLVPALLAALLWMPILLPLYDGLGFTGLVVIGVLAAILFTTFAPLVPASGRLGRRWVPLAALVLALVCAGLAYASAPFSQRAPQPLSIVFHQDADSGQARWVIRRGALPGALQQAAQFSLASEAYPWSGSGARVAPAPRLDVPGPQVSVLEDSVVGSKRRLRLLLTSNRQAPRGSLQIPPAAKLESIRVEGQAVPRGIRPAGQGPVSPDEWREISVSTLPPDGAEIEVVLSETRPQDWYVVDSSPGLPPSGEALRKARPADSVPSQEGDRTLVSHKVRI
jgi:hypothetical protein